MTGGAGGAALGQALQVSLATALCACSRAAGLSAAAGADAPFFRTLEQCPTVESAHYCQSSRARSVPTPDMSALDSPAVRKSLRGVRIALMGDSQAQELFKTLNGGCGVDPEVRRSLGYIAFHVGFHTVPHLEEDLMHQFREVASWSDVIVFSFGSWYNFDWTSLDDSVYNRDATVTADDLRKYHCNELPIYKMEGEAPFEYAQWRRKCRTIGIDHFVSDLVRLREAIVKIKTEFPKVRIIWKSIPPQHFETPSGQYDFAKARKDLRCVPIQNRTMAYSRNEVANHVLSRNAFEVALAAGGRKRGRRRRRRGQVWPDGDSSRLLEMLDTWEDDVDKHELHDARTGDCTHFCNPSAVTWNWARALMQAIAAGRS